MLVMLTAGMLAGTALADLKITYECVGTVWLDSHAR
jgi:hypothetical protein